MTRRRRSIALRLAVSLSAGMALLWVGAATISIGVLQHELSEAYDDSLRESALRLLPLAVHDLGEREHADDRFIVGRPKGDGDGDDQSLPPMQHDAAFTYFVRDPIGAIVLRDEHAPADLPELPLAEGFSDLDGRRTFTVSDPRSAYSITIIELSDRRLTALRDSIATLGWPLLALIPLIAGGVWVAMRLALHPLELLRRDIAQRDSRNLAPLRSDGHPVELAPIAEAVAALLERLKSALDAERSFAARSAHELRTPIAGALAQTQQLADELEGRPEVGRVREIEAALKRLSQLSETLLQLARIEAGFARADDETNLLPVLEMVVRDVNANTQWRDRVHLDSAAAAAVPAALDPDAFAVVMRNLIENALKHGSDDGVAEVRLDGKDIVRVRNAGPVVGEEELARLGQPFVRGATAADGTGLGLSIARSILEQAGGRLELHSPASGSTEGFEVIVVLPRLPRGENPRSLASS